MSLAAKFTSSDVMLIAPDSERPGAWCYAGVHTPLSPALLRGPPRGRAPSPAAARRDR